MRIQVDGEDSKTPFIIKVAGLFAGGRSSLEAPPLTPRCVSCKRKKHPSLLSFPFILAYRQGCGGVSIFRDIQMPVKRDREGTLRDGFQDRGAWAGDRLRSRGYRGKAGEGGKRWEVGFNL